MEWRTLMVLTTVGITLLYHNECLLVMDKCMNSTECPLNSACGPQGCDGDVCLCSDGYVPANDLTGCFKAAELSRACDGVTVLCRDKLAVCVSGRCECRSSYVPTEDNLRCKIKPAFGVRFALLGEPCDEDTLCQRKAEQSCDPALSRCVCDPGLRPATPEELLAEPFSDHGCRPQNFSLGSIVEDLICLEPKLPVSAAIGEVCVSYNNCPAFADCLARGCDGTVCVCIDGYYPTNNGMDCKPVASLGDVCGEESVCHGQGVTTACVSGVCTCDVGFSPTPNGRCKPVPEPRLQYALFGEACGHVGQTRIICEDKWTTCDSIMDGTCVCQYGTREASNEERARDVNNPSPCRLHEYQLEDVGPKECERQRALEQCQNWKQEEVFWRDWFKQRLINMTPDPPRQDWDWVKQWKSHRDKLRRCSQLMPVTDDDNWSEEVREVRVS
ncbi:tenascin-like [Liolophura sinensis]|uniref:tenascin-like n=1 Tax=Liolophura sinensis TaxID=3198878 RepID=UPI0031587B03